MTPSSAPESCAELIDGSAAGEEVRDHLRGDLGGIGRDALRGDAMIAGGDDHKPLLEVWTWLPSAGDALRECLETTERSGRLGERRFPGGHGGGYLTVAAGKIETGRTQFVQGSETRHFGVDSNA